MLRKITFLLLLLGSTLAIAQPRIAIIIDDLGDRREDGIRAVELPGAVTVSILPHTPYAGKLANLAHAYGKEVMLHLPLESEDGRELGPGGIDFTTTRTEMARIVNENLVAVPHVRGINNHMGSSMTRDATSMKWLMQVISASPGMFFVDSMTTADSLAHGMARHYGIPALKRDVFLDAIPGEAAFRNEFQRLLEIARKQGQAVAIAHPYPETLPILAELISGLPEAGIELVPASALLATTAVTARAED